MGYSKEDRIIMIMDRTMFNLNYINKRKPDDPNKGPYEVTQLVNSFLGALAHPWEKLKKEFNKKSIKESIKDGWPVINKELQGDETPKNLGHLLRLIRNAMAHGNIEFLSEGEIIIERIHIVNIDTRCGHRTWGAVIEIDDMRMFLDKFVETAKELKKKSRQI